MQNKARKDITTKDDLFFICDLLEQNNIIYWIDGGWGIDILASRETRPHRDIDIDFDSKDTLKLLSILEKHQYVIETDWRPTRIELYNEKYGYLDIHPFVLNADGTSKQSDLNGGYYEFESDYFSVSKLYQRLIPCISIKGQLIFHSGYEKREKDELDIIVLKSL